MGRSTGMIYWDMGIPGMIHVLTELSRQPERFTFRPCDRLWEGTVEPVHLLTWHGSWWEHV